MYLNEQYLLVFWGIAALIFLLFVQWLVASMVKAAQPGAIPGKVDPQLDHHSFVFRAHRTFSNSLENSPAMFGTSVLAVLVGVKPEWAALCVWVLIAARVLHMALYYVMATNSNPSPRSYAFMLGVLANLALFGLCINALLAHT
ncbi:MAG: MAPEG family protein [Aeromonadales bacterium]|nr:MAPEG family protein [Aeromonadales bacterium]